jgi:hypothetical protein
MDLLRDDMRGLRAEIQSVTSGSTGVPVLQTQLYEVVKDMAELRSDMNTRFDSHLKEHQQASRDRVTGRRWLIGTAFAGIGALAGLYAMIFDLLSRH